LLFNLIFQFESHFFKWEP